MWVWLTPPTLALVRKPASSSGRGSLEHVLTVEISKARNSLPWTFSIDCTSTYRVLCVYNIYSVLYIVYTMYMCYSKVTVSVSAVHICTCVCSKFNDHNKPICNSVHKCTYTLGICVHAHAHIRIHVHMYTCIHVHTCIHSVHTCIHVHTCTCTYTHMYMYIYKQMSKNSDLSKLSLSKMSTNSLYLGIVIGQHADLVH